MEQADWDELKEQMASPYGSMALKCDGYELNLYQVTDPKTNSWYTTIYVDGYFKGIWFQCVNRTGEPAHEETRRFMRKVTRGLYNKRDIEFHRRVHGKRAAEKAADIKWYTYDHCWKSFNSLKKHLLANNKEITRLH